MTDPQLSALSEVSSLLEEQAIDYWLFGGWAVDFYVGAVTRPHFDIDLAVWHADVPRIEALLTAGGWRHAPLQDEDGGTGYEREALRLELTYLVRDAEGRIAIPLHDRLAIWPDGALAGDRGELGGVQVRLVALAALAAGKASPRDDPDDAAKDRADFGHLSRLPGAP